MWKRGSRGSFEPAEIGRAPFVERIPPVLAFLAHVEAEWRGSGEARQPRPALLKDLVGDPARHLILVTATPHSGNEDAFRSLLSLLDGDFIGLPHDRSGDSNRAHRERLARHFVQRRRADLDAYLATQTPSPKREIAERHDALRPAYRAFPEQVLAGCRETARDETR